MITDRIGLHSVLLPLLIKTITKFSNVVGYQQPDLSINWTVAHVMLVISLRSKRFRRVWEQRKTEERGFRYFACAENGARAKKRTVGVGEGKEGTACGQTPGF